MHSGKLKINCLTLLVGAVVLLVTGCAGSHSGHKMGGAVPGEGKGAVNWVSYEEGVELARKDGKLMIVDFYVSEGCHRCEVMDKAVYGHPKIAAKINQDFIPVRVDLERPLPAGAKKIGKQYDFKFDCLLVICDAEGNAIKDEKSGRMCFAETVDPDWFIEYLDKAFLESYYAEQFFKDM